MKYLHKIQDARNDPELLEDMYQTAQQEKKVAEFTAALMACYQASSDNLLYAAWYHRLQRASSQEQAEERSVNWKLAVPLSLVLGLIFWLFSQSRFEFFDGLPYLFLGWAPVGASFIIAFLTLSAGKDKKSALWVIAALVGIGIYATVFTVKGNRRYYRDLMMLHLPLAAWVGAGVGILRSRSGHQNRFAFLIKSIEVFITGGLYMGAGGAFVAITSGMFQALGINLSDSVMRLLVGGGFGLIPVLAVAGVYDPHASPVAQKFRQGLGKVISTLMRLLLPLTLLVLVVYLFVIPFNFMEPFRNRDVLIIYNVMLFAVMGLLIGATPVRARDLTPKHQSALRAGILAAAILTVLISLYALSATVYRTVEGGITMNRLTIIGWNSINIGILVLLIYKQFKDGLEQWIDSLQSVFSRGTIGYIVWMLFVTLAIPLLFRG